MLSLIIFFYTIHVSFFLPFSLIPHLILFTKVWFSLSFKPLENGEFIAVKIIGIFFSFRKFLNSLELIPGY